MATADVRLRRLGSTDLSAADVAAIRAILDAAFDDGDPEERFTEDDWQHGLGGVHVVLDIAGETASGDQPTPDEDGYLLVLRTPMTPPELDESDPISCEWRPGDVW